MPFDRDDLKRVVKQFLDSSQRQSPFPDNIPGIDWLLSFEKRHPDLAKRKPQLLAQNRANNATPETINLFFDMYEKVVKENNLTADQIWNCNETGLNTDMTAKKVFIPKGKKDSHLKSPTAGKTSYSVLACGSASGRILPPFTVYKGKNLYAQWTKNGPPNAGYGCSESRWIHDANFESWFAAVFVPALKDTPKPVLLTYDGHNSHLTYKTIKIAQENNVIIMCLPPHTSQCLQPLDVGFFHPFKMIWKDELKNWARASKYKPVTKAVFPTLLKNAWAKITQKSITGGFKGMTIYFVIFFSKI